MGVAISAMSSLVPSCWVGSVPQCWGKSFGTSIAPGDRDFCSVSCSVVDDCLGEANVPCQVVWISSGGLMAS